MVQSLTPLWVVVQLSVMSRKPQRQFAGMEKKRGGSASMANGNSNGSGYITWRSFATLGGTVTTIFSACTLWLLSQTIQIGALGASNHEIVNAHSSLLASQDGRISSVRDVQTEIVGIVKGIEGKQEAHAQLVMLMKSGQDDALGEIRANLIGVNDKLDRFMHDYWDREKKP